MQRLVLLPKPGKRLGDPSSYRPICLLDTVGKVLERIVYNRLLPVIENRGGLSDRQFGFRKARSTIDAIQMVTRRAKEAIEGKRARNKYCAVITLDVKNAFNSARWQCIMDTLQGLGVPPYLAKIISSYFDSRKLCYETEDGPVSYDVSAGVPQGSVLGPLLWNIMYNGVLTLKIPDESSIIGFADDIAVVTIASHIDEVELYANETLYAIRSWMNKAGLQLAEQKTEVVLITRRKKKETLKIKIGQENISSKDELKYLGVIIDSRLTFDKHLSYARDKAANIGLALARMMPNVGGPRQKKRMMISRVFSSSLLYAAPVWSSFLSTTSRRKISSAYRLSALRVCCAYRTTSNEAACTIAGMIPIDILADESRRLYERKKTQETETIAMVNRSEREASMRLWQHRWENCQKGRWTYTLIPKVKTWVERSHGEVDYYLTQFLTGHGGYRKYLFKYGHDISPVCPSCPGIEEDAEHVIFVCPRFEEIRTSIFTNVGQNITPTNIMEIMMSSEEKWRLLGNYIRTILKKLRMEEDIRKANRRTEAQGDVA